MKVFQLGTLAICLLISFGCREMPEIKMPQFSEVGVGEISAFVQTQELFFGSVAESGPGGEQQYFIEIEIVNSPVFPTLGLPDNLIQASKCAAIAHSHLGPEQPYAWNEIQIKVVVGEKDELHRFSFPELNQATLALEKTLSFLKSYNQSDPESILPHFTSHFVVDNPTFINVELASIRGTKGPVLDCAFLGFRKESSEFGKEHLLLFCDLQFESGISHLALGFKSSEPDRINWISI